VVWPPSHASRRIGLLAIPLALILAASSAGLIVRVLHDALLIVKRPGVPCISTSHQPSRRSQNGSSRQRDSANASRSPPIKSRVPPPVSGFQPWSSAQVSAVWKDST